MKNKKVIEDLKLALTPYLVLWEDWIKDERCNLNREEIDLVNRCLKNNFEFSPFERFLIYHKTNNIQKILSGLKNDYHLFTDWVILKFLCEIIRVAKNTGKANFINVPIEELKIPGKIKTGLKIFEVSTLRDFALRYTIEELSSERTFKNILEFQRSCKTGVKQESLQTPIL